MMGLVKTADLYRCGASYAGVMDLTTQLKDDKHYLNAYELDQLYVGDLGQDANRLKANSPYRRADEIHGWNSRGTRVDFEQRLLEFLQACTAPRAASAARPALAAGLPQTD
jgi:hypothetical protein